ncbi:uncharacterized protein RHOBADRAFT_51219 [Rhodotorula graminis WP1]|uniref:Uncharacterized protein n=1 Tax=Rhodotorula graminis (strain WP1) TaxID=578459 RepID=A0A194S9S3_RHOGW|nr:uncharacterized protein RHOBADRAFT_51219 [Rhodotorula graminis WP1]KPV77347.1 hypothetical protein RHOBADRAFT_51219 [Rhodotorula graminis WP1]
MPFLWPSHKVLCGRDPDMFYLPDLSTADVARLESFKNEFFADYDETFADFVSTHLGLPWPAFLVTHTAIDPDADDSTPALLGCRNLNLVLARKHLYQVARARDPSLRIVDLPIWDPFSDVAEGYVDRCVSLQADEAAPRWDPADPWRALNAVLRQDLVRHTLFLKQRECQPDISQKEVGRLSILSFERAAVEARRAPVPQVAKDEIVGAFEECVENSIVITQSFGVP